MKFLQNIIITYNSREFKIRHILGDTQHEFIRKLKQLMGINVNITACEKHFPEI